MRPGSLRRSMLTFNLPRPGLHFCARREWDLILRLPGALAQSVNISISYLHRLIPGLFLTAFCFASS
jgi:hypothetical protein